MKEEMKINNEIKNKFWEKLIFYFSFIKFNI
jgi:hypothetical protein